MCVGESNAGRGRERAEGERDSARKRVESLCVCLLAGRCNPHRPLMCIGEKNAGRGRERAEGESVHYASTVRL